ARLVIFDMPLTALVTAALACLVRARTEGNPWRWLPLAGLAMGLATLTKGPVGIAVPLLAWFAGRGALARPARRNGAGPILAGVAVAALVVVPWLAVVVRREPDFPRYAALDETHLRLFATARFHSGGHVYFYLEALAGAAALVAALAGFEGRGGNFAVLAPRVLAPVGIFLLGWGAAAALGRRPVGAPVACALFAPGVGFVLFRPLGAWAETRSSRALATYIEPGARIICFETFRESLPFYLGRPVVLLSDDAPALASNYVLAQRGRLGASDDLLPERSLDQLLDHASRPYVLASRWNAGRLTRLSPRPLVEVHSDRRSILFRPRG